MPKSKIIPFEQKIQEPEVHVLANKIVGAMYQLQERWGLKVVNWFFDDSGKEVDFEDLETLEQKTVTLGR